MNVVLSVISLLVTLSVLAVQVGFWGGGVSARKPPSIAPPPAPTPDEEKTPGRLREVINAVEATATHANQVAQEARNVANMAAAQLRQSERDAERIERALTENTRRIDELWRAVRSAGEGA